MQHQPDETKDEGGECSHYAYPEKQRSTASNYISPLKQDGQHGSK